MTASMRPQPDSRGNPGGVPDTLDGDPIFMLQCGHSLIAVEIVADLGGALGENAASMRPQPDSRGNRGASPTCRAASARPRLQCGHSLIAVEIRPPRRRWQTRTGFNAATA